MKSQKIFCHSLLHCLHLWNNPINMICHASYWSYVYQIKLQSSFFDNYHFHVVHLVIAVCTKSASVTNSSENHCTKTLCLSLLMEKTNKTISDGLKR